MSENTSELKYLVNVTQNDHLVRYLKDFLQNCIGRHKLEIFQSCYSLLKNVITTSVCASRIKKWLHFNLARCCTLSVVNDTKTFPHRTSFLRQLLLLQSPPQ
uniref:Uncharacterized protein n=1 Tax=Sphaerodactylus townsendi TaxID=933632 RepID=A0ACB8FUN2_9SAUR